MSNSKIKMLSFNIQGKYSNVESHLNGKKTTIQITKIHRLITYMKEHKFDIACIQETKAKQGWLTTEIMGKESEASVVECGNIQNPNKGGVAIFSINPDIKIVKNY